MTTDVIVKTYQRPWLLGICLESIRYHWGSGLHVVVADDGTAPDLWELAVRRYGHLADEWVHAVQGEPRWGLCREGRFGEAVHSCGGTWNRAFEACTADTIFLIEDDSRVSRDMDVSSPDGLLKKMPELLCIIGMRVRCNMETGGDPTDLGGETYLVRSSSWWPWSFDGVFYRRKDWSLIGPWPEGVATGPMENFVLSRLKALGWRDRPFATTADPCCDVDSQTSCRTDHPSTYRGRFRHVDAINAAWAAGSFVPTYDHVAGGRAPWIGAEVNLSAGLHYPRALRQCNFVTGHELCGDLKGAEADARWLAQANGEAARYGEPLYDEVPAECRSEPFGDRPMAKKPPPKPSSPLAQEALRKPEATPVPAPQDLGFIDCTDANAGTEAFRTAAASGRNRLVLRGAASAHVDWLCVQFGWKIESSDKVKVTVTLCKAT